jgi:hypothetical protein
MGIDRGGARSQSGGAMENGFFKAAGGGMREEPPPASLPPGPDRRIPESLTVFEGEKTRWEEYLAQSFARRFDGFFCMLVEAVPSGLPVLRPENERSVAVCAWLGRSLEILGERLARSAWVNGVFADLVAGNTSNREAPLHVVSHEGLPAHATREIRFGRDFRAEEVRIVVRTRFLQRVDAAVSALGDSPKDMDLLGAAWPVLSRLILQLSYPNYPRDRFIERIALTARWALFHLHALFDGKQDGRLVPNRAGQRWLDEIAAAEEIPVQHLFTRHPLCRLLSDLSFLHTDRAGASLLPTAEIVTRDSLDAEYLRLSIAGLMPPSPGWLHPMPCQWKGKKTIAKPKPRAGSFGILDNEDLDAWKQVDSSFRDIGYSIVAQLGIGQFGRVYEAVNLSNPVIPGRVAVKVDRIRKGRKKQAIEAAENIMETARGLAASPHVIRIFDAGKIRRERATYHILQLVDGDTLDNLIGITGMEHTSIPRPPHARSSPDEVRRQFLASLGGSPGEAWRKARATSPFLRRPGLAHMLDILASKVLWVEEVHRLGFAVNDLKNGNVMISRRGQFKGIDVDSYSPVFSQLDKLADFFFLAVSALQLITGGGWQAAAPDTADGFGSFLADQGALRKSLEETWSHGDLREPSDGRIEKGDVIDFFTGFIGDAKGGVFAREPARFGAAIDRLIAIKRMLCVGELVLE